MDDSLKTLITKQVDDLMTWIVEKNPSIDQGQVWRKMVDLGFCESRSKVKKAAVKSRAVEERAVNRAGNRMTIKVKKSDRGNFILSASSSDTIFDDLNESFLVMDLTTKNVIGFQNSSGEIASLNKNLIGLCNKYKLRFKWPLNLNTDDRSAAIDHSAIDHSTSVLEQLKFNDDSESSENES